VTNDFVRNTLLTTLTTRGHWSEESTFVTELLIRHPFCAST